MWPTGLTKSRLQIMDTLFAVFFCLRKSILFSRSGVGMLKAAFSHHCNGWVLCSIFYEFALRTVVNWHRAHKNKGSTEVTKHEQSIYTRSLSTLMESTDTQRYSCRFAAVLKFCSYRNVAEKKTPFSEAVSAERYCSILSEILIK